MPATWRWGRIAAVVGVAAVAVPFIAIIVVSLTRTWFPTGDVALMEVRTADVGGPYSPLLGVYSRFNWYHPGPLAYWVLAVPYRLLGARPPGMLVGTALVHGAAVAGSLALAWRRGGRTLALATALGMVLLIQGLGAERLVYYWNPYLPLFAVALLIMATWSVLDGDIQFLPLVIAVSCFTWQAHFGYLGVGLALAGLSVLGALVLVGRDLRSDGPARYRPRSLIILGGATALTTAICLAPIAIEQLTNRPGNITRIVRSRGDDRYGNIGLEWAAGILGKHLSPLGIWLTGPQHIGLGLGSDGAVRIAIPIAALIVATALAARYRQWSALRFLLVTSFTAVAGWLAVSRTLGVPYPYLSDWLRPLAVLLWLSVGWALLSVARDRGWLAGRLAVRLVPVAAIVAALVIAVTVVRTVTGEPLQLPDDEVSAPVEHLTPGMLQAVAGQSRVRIRAAGGWCAGELAHGLTVQLVEHGTDVVVDPELFPLEYGRERARRDEVPLIELACGPNAGERVAGTAAAPVSTSGLFDAEEMGRFRGMRFQVQSRLRAMGHGDIAEAVENPIVGAVAFLADSDAPGDKELAARFEDFLKRAGRSGAVYYWPDGVSHIRA